jgi:hypothetical protein
LEINSANPSLNISPAIGDLWYNSLSEQLHVYNGTEYILIGPPIGADTQAGWRGDFESSSGAPNTPIYNIKAVINDEVVAIVSNQTYSLSPYANSTYSIYNEGEVLHKGINLKGADPLTGNSESAETYFWGTAAHSLRSNTSTYTNGFATTVDSSNAYRPVAFLNTSSVSNGTVSINYGFTYNPSTNYVKATRFEGVATSALYADLAERYEADAEYEAGTVLVIGGDKEVTTTAIYADTRVAGIVSTNPAYMMNSEAGTDETHPYIALKGRVPCKVIGPIKKGELVVASGLKHGYATARQLGDDPHAVIGKALQDFAGPSGVIEVKV